MRIITALAIASAAVTSGCGGEEEPGGRRVVELESGLIEDIPPGADLTYCTYLEYEAVEEADIVQFLGQQTDHGHHTILYSVRSKQPPGTHLCTEADMFNVGYLAAGGAETGGQATPEGVAFRLQAGKQLMIQSHFINATEEPISGSSSFSIELEDPDPSRQPANLFTVVTTDIEIPAHGTGTAHAECTVGERTQLVMLGGHAHEWGTRVSISHGAGGAEPSVIYDEVWNSAKMFDPTIQRFEAAGALTFEAGDVITVDCEYLNDTDEPLAFPSEMCVGFGYYFPAERQLDCVDGNWPG